jgi:hypothetical protein
VSEELKITKERVLAAASKCTDAREVLKELFPEAFEDKWFDLPLILSQNENYQFNPNCWYRFKYDQELNEIIYKEIKNE